MPVRAFIRNHPRREGNRTVGVDAVRPHRHGLHEPLAHQRREIRHVEPPVFGGGHRRETQGNGPLRALGPIRDLIAERVGEKLREVHLLGLLRESVPGGEPLAGAARSYEPRARILVRHQVGLDPLAQRSGKRTEQIRLEQGGPQVARCMCVGQERDERSGCLESRHVGEPYRRAHHAVHARGVRNRVHVAQHPCGARLALGRFHRPSASEGSDRADPSR